MDIDINENGIPRDFRQFLEDLAISGHADGRTARYDVDVKDLPHELSSLTLKSVTLLNPPQLKLFSHLTTLSLSGIYFRQGEDVEIQPQFPSLLGTQTTVAGGSIKELNTQDAEVLTAIPKSLTALTLHVGDIDAKKLQNLKAMTIERLTVVRDIVAGNHSAPEPFDLVWLPPTLTELSLSNVPVMNLEKLLLLNRLAKLKLESSDVIELHSRQLPKSLREISIVIDGCPEAHDLKQLPSTTNRLAIECIGDLQKVAKILRRFPSQTAFSGLEISDGGEYLTNFLNR